MKPRTRRFVPLFLSLAALIALALALPLSAHAISVPFAGKVVDADTGKALGNCTVEVRDFLTNTVQLTTTTSPTGDYHFNTFGSIETTTYWLRFADDPKYMPVGSQLQHFTGTTLIVNMNMPEVAHRVGGSDRYAVGANVATSTFTYWNDPAYWSNFTDVVIASGADSAMADPLAAAGLCGVYNAPLLLVTSTSTPIATKKVIRQIADNNWSHHVTIHIVGGAASVADARYNEIAAYVGAGRTNKDRILSTGTRYDMAAAIARRMKNVLASRSEAMTTTVLFANGANPAVFWDALACGPASAHNDIPILLVSQTSVPAATSKTVTWLHAKRKIVAGGTASVSETVRKQLGATRWGGATTQATARIVATNACNAGWLDGGTCAVAAKLPDALTGGVGMGLNYAFYSSLGGPILFTGSTKLGADAKAFMASHGTDRSLLLGGLGSASAQVQKDMQAY